MLIMGLILSPINKLTALLEIIGKQILVIGELALVYHALMWVL